MDKAQTLWLRLSTLDPREGKVAQTGVMQGESGVEGTREGLKGVTVGFSGRIYQGSTATIFLEKS